MVIVFFPEYNLPGLTGKKDSFGAAYCSFIFHLAKILGIIFKPTVSILYYQKFSLQKWFYGK